LRYNDYVEYEKELKLMTDTNYVYTLQDLYKMFQQEEWTDVKVQLLREWQAMNLPYNINWDNLISKYVI
jgi:hypothetical protein